MSPSLVLKTVRSLKDSTFQACATISAYSKSSLSTPKSSESESKVSKFEIKHLLIELRLLGGSLHSLESFVTELTADNDTSGDSTLGITPSASGSASGNDNDREWPMIDKCEILIAALKSFHAYATSDGIKAARASLSDVRFKLVFLLGSSDTLEDIAHQFSILTTDPVPQLMVQKESDCEALEAPDHVYDDDEPSAADVSGWLTILNSPENDREPAEYNRETILIQERRITEPKYRVAAARWPEHAETYWRQLRPQVCTLFRIPKSFSFVQWVLEYARVTYPRTLGALAVSPRLLLELTDALCNGSVSSLHIAAALGLPSLCKDLLSMGAQVNQSSLIGTPLFCALVGSKVLATRTEPESWTTLLVGSDSNTDQAATILLLIDAGADCKYRYTWKNVLDEVSLAGLAFWTAMISKHEDVFTRIAKGGGDLDRSFHRLLQRETLIKRGLLHRARFAHLLTYAYDLTLRDIERDSTDYVEIQYLVSKVMKRANVKFSPATDGKIDTLSDGSFAEVIRTAVLDFNVRLVERLTKDPRFDPNFPYDNDGTSGTILHMATEGAQLEIMDILIRAGADVRARDSSGRTPLMVVEEIGPLGKLILEHSAPTQDTDNGGRNIWHLFAATNDVKLLMYLWLNDSIKIRNLGAVCEDGYTPLRAAFAYVETLKELPKSSNGVEPLAARFLMHHCQEYLKPEGNEQLARWAVEWGDALLVKMVFRVLPSANTAHESLLRSLNISACPKIVSLVLDKAGPSRPFSDGLTPAETVITNTKLLQQRPGFTARPSLHPSCYPKMTRGAYMDLLTPEVLQSRDKHGRGLWARFCDDVLSMLDGPSVDLPTSMHFLYDFARMAISCLLHKGALLDHEKETGEWAISRICKKVQVGPVTWTAAKLPFVAAVLEASWEVEDPEGRAKVGSREFFETRDAAVLLSLAVRSRKPDIVGLLVQSGINVHKPWESFGGRSIFEDFLADEPVDVSMIMPLLGNTKAQDLVANQHYTFQEVLSIPQEDIALEILEVLIDCGMDVNSLEVNNQPSFRSPIHDSPGPSMLVKALCRSRIAVACMLVRHGADASLAPPDSISGFMLVAKIGFVVVLEAIIEKATADFDWLCRFNALEHNDVFNALQFAAIGGHRDVLMALLEATPLVGEIDTVSPRYGRSAAHLAAKAGSLDCIKVLTRYGANLTLKDYSGRTPLFYALVGPSREVAEYIGEHMPDSRNIVLPPSMPDSAASPNMPSDASSDVDMAEASSVTDENSDPQRLGDLLAHAIDRYQLKRDALFRPLLNHASKRDLESAVMPCKACTLLSYTASKNLIRPMLELLDLGFKGFVTSCEEHWGDGYNALVDTARNIQSLMAYDMFISPEKAYSFFEKCLDAYLQEERIWFHLGTNPIHALFESKNAVAQPNLEHEYNVLQIFINHLTEHAEQYWTLMNKFGLLSQFHFTEDESIAKRVLRFAINLGTLSDGTTPLHSISEFRCGGELATSDEEIVCKMAKLLIDSGADVNAQESSLATPLHCATTYDHLPMIDLLLEAGADQHVLDCEGLSPLAYSLTTANDSLDITRHLVEHGGNLATLAVHSFPISEKNASNLHDLLELGLDPFSINLPSLETTFTCMLSEVQSYALNGDFDFYRLAEEEPSFLRTVYLAYFGVATKYKDKIKLKAIIKRIPWECRARVVNFEPGHGLNVVFWAILLDLDDKVRLFLDAGFDIDREWHGRGSALMFASSVGAFKCFKLLIQRGAKISYLGTGRREPVMRSAVEEAKRRPKLLHWLLVGRYYETDYLTEKEHNGPDTTIKPWSGPRKALYTLSGVDGECSRLHSESTIFYAQRVSTMRKSLEGRVVPVTFV